MSENVPLVTRAIKTAPNGEMVIEGTRDGLRALGELLLRVASDPSVEWAEITDPDFGCSTLIRLFGAGKRYSWEDERAR